MLLLGAIYILFNSVCTLALFQTPHLGRAAFAPVISSSRISSQIRSNRDASDTLASSFVSSPHSFVPQHSKFFQRHLSFKLYSSSETIDAIDTNMDVHTNIIETTNNMNEKINESNNFAQVSFSHVHFHVDSLEPLHVYKELEHSLNTFATKLNNNQQDEYNTLIQRLQHGSLTSHQSLWNTILHSNNTNNNNNNNRNSSPPQTNDVDFISQNRDLVKQLIIGLGFRITGQANTSTTTSYLLTTKDSKGVQFVITAKRSFGGDVNNVKEGDGEDYGYTHFDIDNINEFYKNNAQRQGISTLAFQVTPNSSQSIDSLYDKYSSLHAKLLPKEFQQGPLSYSSNNNNNGGKGTGSSSGTTTTKVLEVYAYYTNQMGSDVDRGTRLRFVEQTLNSGKEEEDCVSSSCILPGIQPVDAIFDDSCMVAYCDHWVSNVISRTGFIDTLEDVLGFSPKVDFNAGVVAAGEAQIESTVTGNDSSFTTFEKDIALQDQSQVYLPINNALTEVGHVHGFLDEIGQGIQHIASRVDNLAAFVQRGNDYRKITGEGLTFLKIPRSYYGVLSERLLIEGVQRISSYTMSAACASALMELCTAANIISPDGAVDIEIQRGDLSNILDEKQISSYDIADELKENKDAIIDIILSSRYTNLYNLLGDNLSEGSYLDIVRNQILVDVQGEDLLFQIFTCSILQKKAGDEAPFLEFIQRVCSECKDENGCAAAIKPGCGGFGIRNFLTLFLSIEVGKAMLEVSRARDDGDLDELHLAQKKVDTFTDQLNESNPILTLISDAMTQEGNALAAMQEAEQRGDEEMAAIYRQKMEVASEAKIKSNEKLMECSAKYNNLMKSLRMESTSIS